MNLQTSVAKASIAIIIFSIAGLVSWHYLVSDWKTSLPLAIFYAALLYNTFFSIRLFSSLVPIENTLQNGLDILLAFLYIAAAISLNNVKYFVLTILFLFIIATAKYVSLIGIIPHPSLLRKKLLIDCLGILASAFAFGGIAYGYVELSIWLFTLAYVIVNLFLFSFWPLYRLP